MEWWIPFRFPCSPARYRSLACKHLHFHAVFGQLSHGFLGIPKNVVTIIRERDGVSLTRRIFEGEKMRESNDEQKILEEIEDLDSLEVLEAEDLDDSVAFHAFRFRS